MHEDGLLSAHLRTVISDEIQRDERIRWSAQPRPVSFAKQAIPLSLFGIPFFGFAIFWMVGAGVSVWFKQNDGPFNVMAYAFPLFGLPFLLIGLLMVGSPLIFAWMARRTVYVVTDRRSIIFEGGWSTKVSSYPHDAMRELVRVQRADGSGDLIFEEQRWRDRDGDRRTKKIGFFCVPRVRQVQTLVEELATEASRQVEPS